jgi:hypothetical protein
LRICRAIVALGVAFGMFAVVSGNGLVASAATTVQPPLLIRQFSACVLAQQAPPFHKATLAEATKCAPSLQMFKASSVGSLVAMPSSFLVTRADGSAALEMITAPSTAGAASLVTASSCYNTWANPTPWGSSGIDWVSINVWGYGNHCNYANVPSTPTVTAQCTVPGCSATFQAGHYDSVYGKAAFNMNSAAGWANIYFSFIGDSWACRGYVDTNGNRNPGQFCS